MTRKRDLRRRARLGVGEVVHSELVCLACGHEAEAWYRRPPEYFACPACGRRAAVRDEEQPYPPPPEPLTM